MKSLRQCLTATRLLGRDAVVTVSLVVSGLIALLPVFGWSGERAALVSAALVAAGGVVSAWLVAVDRALPLLVGLGKAVVAAVAGFGVHLPDNQVAALMAVLTLVAGLATRTQVGAVQPSTGTDIDGSTFELFRASWERQRKNTGAAFTPTTEYFADPAPARGVPGASDDPPTEVHRAVEMTDYVPNAGIGQMQQYRPGEHTGRHRTERPDDRRLWGHPEFG